MVPGTVKSSVELNAQRIEAGDILSGPRLNLKVYRVFLPGSLGRGEVGSDGGRQPGRGL